MKNRIFSTLLGVGLCFSNISFADETDNNSAALVTAPVHSEILQKGYSKSPVVQCPTINPKYEEILGKIETLKTAIKKDDETCSQEEVKVKDLATLLGKEREKFWELFNKGQTEVLSEGETTELQNYINDVVQKSAAVTELFKSGSGCFNEDKKQSTLSLISSTLNEVSGAIGTLPGPYGAAISMAGKITAGLFSSLDQVLKSRGYYRFNDPEERKVFAKNLCTYFSFKSDIDEITRPQSKLADLRSLEKATTSQLELLGKGCTDCDAIIAKHEPEMLAKNYVLKPWKDLEKTYQESVTAADSKYKKRLGHYTVRSLTTYSWVRQEIERIRGDFYSDNGGLSRDSVFDKQKELEYFFLDRYGANFINSLGSVVVKRRNEFEKNLRTGWYDIVGYKKTPQPDPNFEATKRWGAQAYNIIDYLYKPDFADILVEPVERQKFASLKADVEFHLAGIASAYGAFARYCNFFKYANFGYYGDIANACDGHGRLNTEAVKKMFADIDATSYPASSLVFDVFKPIDTHFTTNWVRSLTSVLDGMVAKEDTLFELK